MRTIHRQLDQFLFLVVQLKDTGEWGFPRRVHSGGDETMRNVAKAAMEECIGNSLETFLVGNAPLGHFPVCNAGGAPATASAAAEQTAADGIGGGNGVNGTFYSLDPLNLNP